MGDPFPPPSQVQAYPALSLLVVAFSAGGDGGGRSPEHLTLMRMMSILIGGGLIGWRRKRKAARL